MRGYNPWPVNPRTKKQQTNRSIFGTLSALASNMSPATEIGLRDMADNQGKRPMHLFISLNRSCVSIDEDEVHVDYPSLTIADGTLGKAEFGPLQNEGNCTVGVDFYTLAEASHSDDDYVYLFAYEPFSKWSMLSFPVARNSCHASLALPGRWTGHEVHPYGFCWSQCWQKASPSDYLGSIILN